MSIRSIVGGRIVLRRHNRTFKQSFTPRRVWSSFKVEGLRKEHHAMGTKTLVIRNGTLIDGSGKDASRNDTIVIQGNRIKSVGALPPDVHLEDRKNVEVIDAAGQ